MPEVLRGRSHAHRQHVWLSWQTRDAGRALRSVLWGGTYGLVRRMHECMLEPSPAVRPMDVLQDDIALYLRNADVIKKVGHPARMRQICMCACLNLVYAFRYCRLRGQPSRLASGAHVHALRMPREEVRLAPRVVEPGRGVDLDRVHQVGELVAVPDEEYLLQGGAQASNDWRDSTHALFAHSTSAKVLEPQHRMWVTTDTSTSVAGTSALHVAQHPACWRGHQAARARAAAHREVVADLRAQRDPSRQRFDTHSECV